MLDRALLERVQGKLALVDPTGKLKPYFVDFVNGRSAHRASQAGLRSEMISKAMGAKKGLKILDATAGLGRDSFVLATLGYQVTALEENRTVFQLFEDGLKRASQDEVAKAAANRITLLNQSIFDFLGSSVETFDVIYLDPMFPQKNKNSLPAKEMQMLQTLLEEGGENSQGLLSFCLGKAARVAIKRPLRAPKLAPEPTYSLKGKSVRFDIYLQSSSPQPNLA